MSEYKKGDKVVFSWGCTDYCSRIRGITTDGKFMRVRFGPWLVFGMWITTDRISGVVDE